MNDFLDHAWAQIMVMCQTGQAGFDTLFAPLAPWGPHMVIFAQTLFVVMIIRLIRRVYVPRRYLELKRKFEHWHAVRAEAANHPDREKGRLLARNIDQAELNKAYYDYFFEGLLKNLITHVIPLLLMGSYVAESYAPQVLLDRFGQEWVFSFTLFSRHFTISALLWFIICTAACYPALQILSRITGKRHEQALAA